MEASDELLTIAELAITLTGFSGVVAAFGHQDGLRKDERFFFVALVIVAISTALLAFVPFIFHAAGITGSDTWKYASGTMLAVAVYETLHLSYIAPTREEGRLGLVAEFVVRSLPVLILFSQIANFFGWPVAPGPLLYIGGLLIWILLSGMIFVYLVTHGTVHEETTDEGPEREAMQHE
ncbi:MAG: hypothetical protein R3228_05615 [Halioglobus sp.]|nr:hypothetical protein [Halioglobus sp.]